MCILHCKRLLRRTMCTYNTGKYYRGVQCTSMMTERDYRGVQCTSKIPTKTTDDYNAQAQDWHTTEEYNVQVHVCKRL